MRARASRCSRRSACRSSASSRTWRPHLLATAATPSTSSAQGGGEKMCARLRRAVPRQRCRSTSASASRPIPAGRRWSPIRTARSRRSIANRPQDAVFVAEKAEDFCGEVPEHHRETRTERDDIKSDKLDPPDGGAATDDRAVRARPGARGRRPPDRLRTARRATATTSAARANSRSSPTSTRRSSIRRTSTRIVRRFRRAMSASFRRIRSRWRARSSTSASRAMCSRFVWEKVTYARCFRGDTRVALVDGTSPTLEDMARRADSRRGVLGLQHRRTWPRHRVAARCASLYRARLRCSRWSSTTASHPRYARSRVHAPRRADAPASRFGPAIADAAVPDLSRGYEMVYQPVNGHFATDPSAGGRVESSRTAFYADAPGTHRHHIDFDRRNNRPRTSSACRRRSTFACTMRRAYGEDFDPAGARCRHQ